MGNFFYLLMANAFCTFYMTGVIWLVQSVSYPGYKLVSKLSYPKYQHHHISNITPVVAPAMIIELATSVLIMFYMPEEWKGSFIFYAFMIALALNLIIWFITVFFSVPIHQSLRESKNEDLINKLIASNWFRTIAWTVRSVIYLGLAVYFARVF